MKFIIRRYNKTSHRGIYRIQYTNGYLYIGSFVNSNGHVIGQTYFGSSKVALHYGWRKKNGVENALYNQNNIKTLEVWYLSEELRYKQSLIEAAFIRQQAFRNGIAACALVLAKHKGFVSRYRTNGKLLNLHANDCTHLLDISVRERAVNTARNNGTLGNAIKTRLKDKIRFKESIRKGVETRKISGKDFFTNEARSKSGLITYQKRGCPQLQTKESFEKSHQTRLRNGYSISAAKVAKSISGKEHFIPIKISVLDLVSGEVYDFNSIKEAETFFEGINIHITRATISQGLKRTKGLYVYKNRFRFKYNE